MGIRTPDVLLKLGARRPAVIVDPWLCLQPAGFTLIQRLQASLEIWIVRELWNILDNSHFYCMQPAALTSASSETLARTPLPRARATDQAGEDPAASRLESTLKLWDSVRLSSDLSGLRLFWLGDGLAESLLPDGAAPSAHARHELLVQSLDGYLRPQTPVACGQRDALALALALGGVPVLSTIEGDARAPDLCERLREGAMPCDRAQGRLAELERDQWHSLLAASYCLPLVWSGLKLALVHVHAPIAPLEPAALDANPSAPPGDPLFEGWRSARLYWHALS